MKKYKIDSSEVQDLVSAAAISIEVSASQTIAKVDLDIAATLSLDEASTPVPGDKVIVKASSDGTARNLTFGTGFTAPVLAGVINKTKVQSFIYDGEGFVADGAPVQID